MIQASGRIPVRVGVGDAIAVRQISVNEKVNSKVHKFANGSRTTSSGQPEYDFSLTCSVLADKQSILAQIREGEALGDLSLSFDLGSETYTLIGCARSGFGISSDSDGTADLTISGVAPDMLQVR